MKRHFLCCMLVVYCSISAADFPVVVQGKAVASIEIGTNLPACSEAADLIRKYIKLVSGADLPLADGTTKIVLKQEKGSLDLEGFRFSFPQNDLMLITGGGANGIRYAALEFCEQFLGVRFLYAGPEGEYLPKRDSISIPQIEFQDAPKYLTRCLTNGRIHHTRKRYQDWCSLLRGCEPYRINCHHSLYQMFDSQKYGKTHPEFYPVHNGKRYIPAPGCDVNWQPCLTASGIVDEAIKIVCDAFAADPELICYPLGITDGTGYCECEQCKKCYPQPEKKNGSGLPDYSRYLVEFYNKVAAGVTMKYPNARMGFLAYNHCYDAPEGMSLHPALTPGLTYDRYSWADPQRRKVDMERHKKWADIADDMMWCDYFYNNRYVLPRIYPHLTADIIRTGFANGVRHFFAEYYTIDGTDLGTMWCDGPSAYLAFKLLWNPERDPDAILNEWYTCAVGEKAAPYLQQYFEELENFWMKQVPETSWFAKNGKTYFPCDEIAYLDKLDPAMLDRCEKAMDQVCSLANDKARAEYLRQGFLQRKAKILYYFSKNDIKNLTESAFDKILFKTDFNTADSTWRIWKHRPTSATAEIVSVGGRTGGACRLSFTEDTGELALEKIIKVDELKDLLISVWVRSNGTDADVFPYISAEWCQNPDSPQVDPMYYSDAAGNASQNWRELQFRLRATSEKPSYLRLRLRGTRSKKGFSFFDDLEIRSR